MKITGRSLTPEELSTPAITVGRPGSGKSLWNTDVALRASEAGYAVFLFDGQGKTALDAALGMVYAGRQNYLVIDKLSEVNCCPQFLSLPAPIATEERELRAELAATSEYITEAVWMAADREGGEKITHRPMILYGTKLGINLTLHQETPLSLGTLPLTLRLGTSFCREAVITCTDPLTKYEYESLYGMMGTPAGQQRVEEKLSPAIRLFDQAFSEQMLARCGTRDYFNDLIDQQKFVIFDGSDDKDNLSDRTITTLFRMMSVMLSQSIKKHYARTKKPRKVLIIFEEAAYFELIGTNELKMIRGLRKAGVCVRFITQDLLFADPAITPALMSNLRRKEWFQCNETKTLEIAGGDIGISLLDEHQLLREETTKEYRMVSQEPTTRVSRTKSLGEDGKESITESEVMQPVYKEVPKTTKEFMKLQDQILKKSQMIKTLRPGFFMYSHNDYATPHPVYADVNFEPYPEEQYPGLAARLYQMLVEQSQKLPYFFTSTVEPWNLITPPEPKKRRPRGRKPSSG